MKKNSEEKSQLIKFESIDVLEEQKPKQIEKDDFVPFRIRRSQIESRLTQKDTVRQESDRERVEERSYRFAGEEKMKIVVGDGESAKYDNKIDLIIAKNANVSDSSRGDFTMRDVKKHGKSQKKELVQVEIPDSVIFKLLQGKTIEKIECKAENCYNIGVNKYPSLKDMEDRAEILAKLLILYNRDEYPTQGDNSITAPKIKQRMFKNKL